MSEPEKQEWIKMGYSEIKAEDLKAYIGTASFCNIDEATEGLMEEFEKINEGRRARILRLSQGDILYFNVPWIESIGCQYELKLGQIIDIVREGDLSDVKGKAKVVKIFKAKKYPNKKWWQFWLKQEEYIGGYNLMIL